MKTTDNETKQEITWGGWLNEFLWICAGVNREVLRQCPTDYAKYAGIGGTILFTALMAMLSGGYALYTVFDNQEVSIAFGLFWGMLIFNLDRFIVNTMYSDGMVTISWREFYCGLPRIIMAIFLGIVISTPLELKIFEDEITVTIEEMKQERIREYKAYDQHLVDSLNAKIEDVKNAPLTSTLQGTFILTGNVTIDNLINSKNQLEAECDQASKNWTNAREGYRRSKTHGDSVKYNNLAIKYSQDYRNADAKLQQILAQLAAANSEYKNLIDNAIKEKKARLAELRAERDAILKRMKNNDSYAELLNKTYGGFQAHMSAFSKMKEDNPSTAISSLFIMLLFIIIETAPTFFKMMIASGPYDDLLRAEMHAAKVYADKKISDVNDEINTAVQISTKHNQNRLAAETLANKQLLEKVAAAQAEILEEAIELWRRQELEKVRNNPAEYIQTGVTPIPQPSNPQA